MIDDWYEIHKISEGVSLIREKHVANWLRCNIWLVRGNNFDLLIDTGMGLRPLKNEIAALSQNPIKVISTHCHFDHIGGAHEFDCRLGHKSEEYIHADPTEHNTGGWNAFVRAETFVRLPDDSFVVENYSVKSAPLTGYLDEGDVLDLGNRVFQIMHLPGHSPGSIALYEKNTGCLFSGDVVYDGALFDTVYHSDPQLYRESLARLRELPIQLVHGGHYDSFGREKLLSIIDRYFRGEGRIGNAAEWVNNELN
ncbi:MAG: MBL fold metallo-hydrolase [Gammaproteobacteria bacterium]|nr:MBL fold metallo-hydrolase [Gammaproteobacteria bacterium]